MNHGTAARYAGRVSGGCACQTSHGHPHALGGAPSAVRALALRDAGRHDEALRVALEALIPHLPRYQRSMAGYARLLTDN